MKNKRTKRKEEFEVTNFSVGKIDNGFIVTWHDENRNYHQTYCETKEALIHRIDALVYDYDLG